MSKSKKKSWTEKRRPDMQHEVKRLDKKFADMNEGETMLIATPVILENYLNQIPPGVEVDINTIRQDLAAEYHADKACPVTTGIFLRIVAEAAWEQHQQGLPVEEMVPFWRAIKPNSPRAKKLTFGQEFLVQQREKEGIGGEKVGKQKKA